MPPAPTREPLAEPPPKSLHHNLEELTRWLEAELRGRPLPRAHPDANAQHPRVRGSGTHSLNFRKTIRERFPPVGSRRPPPEWSRYLHDQLGVSLEPEQINEL